MFGSYANPLFKNRVGSTYFGPGFNTILLDFLGRVHPKKPPHVFRLQFYSKTLSVYVLLPVTRDSSVKVLPPIPSICFLLTGFLL